MLTVLQQHAQPVRAAKIYLLRQTRNLLQSDGKIDARVTHKNVMQHLLINVAYMP